MEGGMKKISVLILVAVAACGKSGLGYGDVVENVDLLSCLIGRFGHNPNRR
jgi:hypothetical protein